MNTVFWTHTFEILVMVGVAFLLGLLLGYQIWARWRDQFRSLQKETDELRRKLQVCESKQTSATMVSAAPVVPEDLKVIEGIGPKIEKLCNDVGIYTLRQLANTPLESLQKMLDDAGPNYRVIDPSTWSQQATLANDGKWDELRAYQDYLVGGRDPAKL